MEGWPHRRQVGGDFCDFLELGRNQLGLVIGDVVGKGVAAALLMAGLQAHLRDQSATYSSRPYILRSSSAGTATWNGRQS